MAEVESPSSPVVRARPSLVLATSVWTPILVELVPCGGGLEQRGLLGAVAAAGALAGGAAAAPVEHGRVERG